MIRSVGTIVVILGIAIRTAAAQDDSASALANVVKLGGKVERTPQLDGTGFVCMAAA